MNYNSLALVEGSKSYYSVLLFHHTSCNFREAVPEVNFAHVPEKQANRLGNRLID